MCDNTLANTRLFNYLHDSMNLCLKPHMDHTLITKVGAKQITSKFGKGSFVCRYPKRIRAPVKSLKKDRNRLNKLINNNDWNP